MISILPLIFALHGAAPVGPQPSPCEAVRCTCMEAPSPQAALTMSDAVFLGTVESLRETTYQLDGVDSGIPAWEVTFRVHASWKGVEATTGSISVTTGHGAGDCGYQFRDGTAYLVYATRVEERLNTSICSRTVAARQARADFDALGQPPVVRHR